MTPPSPRPVGSWGISLSAPHRAHASFRSKIDIGAGASTSTDRQQLPHTTSSPAAPTPRKIGTSGADWIATGGSGCGAADCPSPRSPASTPPLSHLISPFRQGRSRRRHHRMEPLSLRKAQRELSRVCARASNELMRVDALVGDNARRARGWIGNRRAHRDGGARGEDRFGRSPRIVRRLRGSACAGPSAGRGRGGRRDGHGSARSQPTASARA
jgi:hypothetical protein